MANTALTPVQFHGASLFVTTINGVPFVALKPVCESIGLQWEGQLQRIKRHPVLNQGMCVTHTPSAGGDQQTTLLPLDKLNGWLFGVSVRRVKPELRERLTQYQSECFDVLASHFGVKQGVSEISTPAAQALDVQTLCQLILGGVFTGMDFIHLANAVNQRQFRVAKAHMHTGYGHEVAQQIGKGISDTDLHLINTAASLEVWTRSDIAATTKQGAAA